PAFLVFQAEWCGFCRRLEVETLASPIVKDALQPFIGARYDVESPIGSEMARRFNVVGLPGLAVIDSNGDVLARQSGFMDAQHLVRFLEDARSQRLSPEQLAEEALKPGASPEVVFRAAQGLIDRNRESEARSLLDELATHGEPGSDSVM